MTRQTRTACFLQFSARMRPVIEAQLDQYSRFGPGCPERLQAAIRHSLLAPGKRLRPLFVLSAAEICGSPPERALPAACAVEMVHTYSLIHDDLPAMDNDDLRRGRPTCHAAFDEATAILAGDALLTRAFEILARDVQTAELAQRCCLELAQAAGASHLVGGQVDDLAAEQRGGDLATLERIHARKTGAMLVTSLRLGGWFGGATDEQQSHLTAYGTRLGLAFQIVDDLLDQTGDPQQTGKRSGQDAERGKLTFPALFGVEASRQRARQLVEEAVDELASLPGDASVLTSLAHYVVERNH
jgi:geranylgeranyl diphosphate synthase type II